MLSQSFKFCNEKFSFNDDGFFTYSSTEQKRVEDLARLEFAAFVSSCASGDGSSVETPSLNRGRHVKYILLSLQMLSKNYATLDASRTWMCFWGIHSLNILGAEIPQETKSQLITFIKSCQHPDGGYAGGPGQYAHLAPTYAAVMALASLQTEAALKSIDRENLSKFLHRMKQDDGSFAMHEGGECDMRGAYCALAVAALCGLMTDELKESTAEWIVSCQTYEGGFGGEPGAEAHGGYAFCAVGALVIVDRFRLIDNELFLRWLTRRQMKFEGGFQGRTNKLVDGCYSYWQAAVFPLVEAEMAREDRLRCEGLFESRMLEEYILLACQDTKGGLRDKPDKNRDLYHTCYVLSGYAVAQAYSSKREGGILGGPENRVDSINPLFNITTSSEMFAVRFFAEKN